MIENEKSSKIEHIKILNPKRIIWIPLTASLTLITAFIVIYNFIKSTNKMFIYIFIAIIVIAIIANLFYLLYMNTKDLNEKLDKTIEDRNKVKINRDALIKELDKKSSKLDQQEDISCFLKCLFIDLVGAQTKEQKQKLIEQFFEFERKIKL